jgi:hypothetical protein
MLNLHVNVLQVCQGKVKWKIVHPSNENIDILNTIYSINFFYPHNN